MQKLHLSFGFQSMGSGGGGDNVGCGCGGDVTDNDANGDGVQVSIDFKLFPVSAVMLLELADLCDELVLEISSPWFCDAANEKGNIGKVHTIRKT